MIQGLIFDFDGLILNTEASIYQSWQELYRSCGRELSFERFAQTIGTADNEPDLVAELEALVGKPLDQPRLAAWQRARESALILEQLPRPGVKDYLAGAKELGLKVALASSSACSWATGHLSRLGFIQYFDAILAGDDVVHTKPDPALFLAALSGARARAGRSDRLRGFGPWDSGSQARRVVLRCRAYRAHPPHRSQPGGPADRIHGRDSPGAAFGIG